MSKFIITKNLKSTKRKIRYKLKHLNKSYLFIFLALFLTFFFIAKHVFTTQSYTAEPTEIWPVRSIDTMKMSRDMARAKLYDQSYSSQIDEYMKQIKSTGANYVAINTPYDDEFKPYLKRWVSSARKNELHVWFRGNWSSWEGWFEYPKDLTPDQHISKTKKFISENSFLFEDGDIFDACPECENAGYWPQPEKNSEYNIFLIKEHKEITDSFKKINKNVMVRESIIGGRAAETLEKDTIAYLGNEIAIDHYAPSVQSYQEYINFFKEQNSKVMFSEFGAPIPDMHGDMSEEEQAEFIHKLMDLFYKENKTVNALNYWVLSKGTTALYNENQTPRQVLKIIKKYYMPGVIYGKITNSAGESLQGISIKTKDGLGSTQTSIDGNYSLTVPADKTEIIISDPNYIGDSIKINVIEGEELREDFILNPKNADFIYRIKVKLKSIL